MLLRGQGASEGADPYVVAFVDEALRESHCFSFAIDESIPLIDVPVEVVQEEEGALRAEFWSVFVLSGVR